MSRSRRKLKINTTPFSLLGVERKRKASGVLESDSESEMSDDESSQQNTS
jgi:hypothetical protein